LKGPKRSHNEDRHYIDEESRIFIVADGIGGHEAGEVASQMAVDLLGRQLASSQLSRADRGMVEKEIRRAFSSASKAILTEGQRNPRYCGMGTTAVLAMAVNHHMYIASLGDSRAYLARNGAIQQLTHDHTLGQALFDLGQVKSPSSCHDARRRALWKYLGNLHADDVPDIELFDIREADRLLLVTDGLTDVLEDEFLLRVLEIASQPAEAVAALIMAAASENTRDDATCLTVFFGSEDQSTKRRP
jgi:protein phosphatase